jgi:hypothetical protein
MEEFKYLDYFELKSYKVIIDYVEKNDLHGKLVLPIDNMVIIMQSYFEDKKFDNAIIYARQILKYYDKKEFTETELKNIELTYLTISTCYKCQNKKLAEYIVLLKFLSFGFGGILISPRINSLENSFVDFVIKTLYVIIISFVVLTYFIQPQYKQTLYYSLFLLVIFIFIIYDQFYLKDKKILIIKKIIRKITKAFIKVY